MLKHIFIHSHLYKIQHMKKSISMLMLVVFLSTISLNTFAQRNRKTTKTTKTTVTTKYGDDSVKTKKTEKKVTTKMKKK